MSAKRTPLELEIIEVIRRDGPLTFRDFMEAALYHPAYGYYNTSRVKIGPDGDYYTSGNVHEAFGAVLGSAFTDLWSKESAGAPLTILEAGAGTGQLALDILRSLRDEQSEVFGGLHYLIAERSQAFRKAQQSLLHEFRDCVEWLPGDYFSAAPAGVSFNGIVFSNELIDAMPVHLVRKAGGRVQEAYVAAANRTEKDDIGSEAETLALAWGTPSAKDVEDFVAQIGVELLDGQVVEVNLEAIEWLSRVASSITRGLVVTIDYGDLEGHLYARDRRAGTLRSFSGHRISASPLDQAGEQDITSSVNFSALIENGKRFGLEPVSYERQSSFLIRHGILDHIARASSSRNADPKSVNDMLAIKNLLVEGGSSDNFRVLVQRKAI